MRNPLVTLALSTVVGLAVAAPAWSQEPDTVLVNGKILAVDTQFSTYEALAITDGRIVAIGRRADITKLAGTKTRTIDLLGRTVIPGLIDSHMHATRAALSVTTEVNWIGATSLADGLNRFDVTPDPMSSGSRGPKPRAACRRS